MKDEAEAYKGCEVRLAQLAELNSDLTKLRFALLRNAVMLGGGALTVLTAFHQTAVAQHSAAAKILLGGCWISLSLGVMAGCAALFEEVWIAARHMEKFRSELMAHVQSRGQTTFPKAFPVAYRKRFRIFSGICWTLLGAALCLLTASAIVSVFAA